MEDILAHPLPAPLQERYRHWRDTEYCDQKQAFANLAEFGQTPSTMFIACCDSRVNPTSIFEVNAGEMFIHRNIAALVPPYLPGGDFRGTSAVVEYGVTALKVRHIVVMGHSKCGGVEGCYRMCSGEADELLQPNSFVGRWMDILSPRFLDLPDHMAEPQRLQTLEEFAVVTSLRNLMTFPFVAEAIAAGRLQLHGLRIDIAGGGLAFYDPLCDGFVPL